MSQRNGLRPPFRWPGGKRWLVETLKSVLPVTYGRYYEPFVGAGALFFALQPKAASLGDNNEDVINLYQCLKENHGRVGELVRKIPQTPAAYYETRAKRPTERYRRAARTLYLTTLAFNGIHRVNRLGEFNVPFGGRLYPELGSDVVLRRYATALANTDLHAGDFADTLKTARAGDLVYLDPPYTVAHSNNGFIKYNAKIFMPDDQERLALTAKDLADRGCHVVVSNAAHPSIRDLYHGFSLIEVRRSSVMAASTDFRKEVTEYVLTNVVGEA